MKLAFQCKRLRRRLIQSKINHSIYLLGQYVWNIKKFCNKTDRQTNNMKNRDSWCASEKVYISNGQLHNDDSFSVNIKYCAILKCLMNIYTVLKIKWDNRQPSGLQLCIPPAVFIYSRTNRDSASVQTSEIKSLRLFKSTYMDKEIIISYHGMCIPYCSLNNKEIKGDTT